MCLNTVYVSSKTSKSCQRIFSHSQKSLKVRQDCLTDQTQLFTYLFFVRVLLHSWLRCPLSCLSAVVSAGLCSDKDQSEKYSELCGEKSSDRWLFWLDWFKKKEQ